jgi:hypothetical protein
VTTFRPASSDFSMDGLGLKFHHHLAIVKISTVSEVLASCLDTKL